MAGWSRRAATSPGKKFGPVLQRAAALGAYEVGAIEFLCESGMECAIVSGASSGAMNAATQGAPGVAVPGGAHRRRHQHLRGQDTEEARAPLDLG